MKTVSSNIAFSILICVVCAAPQFPEINDQFVVTNITEPEPKKFELQEAQKPNEVVNQNEVEKPKGVEKLAEDSDKTIDDTITITDENFKEIIQQEPEPTVITKLYKTLTDPIVKFVRIPKVNMVMSNIGTCIVNGAMEIISYYFPAPLIPLIASAAGLVIPFEPVVLLREKMPVTSYRRAFKTAIEGFLGTFDRYKYEEEDPYMTRRFNRRFMGNSKEEKKIESDVD